MSDARGTAHDDHGTPAIPDVHGGSAAVQGPHGAATDHGEGGHGHDDHAHGSEALGPVDWTMWAAGVIGVVVAVVITAAWVVATGFSFSA